MLVRRRLGSVPLVLLLAFGVPATASRGDELRDDDARQPVARLAWLEGDVAIARGEVPDRWEPGTVNDPLATSDRLRVGGDSRAELQLQGTVLFLAPGTELSFSASSPGTRTLDLSSGRATVRVFDVRGADDLPIVTPNAFVALELPGLYRVDVSETGDTAISVSRGRVRAATAEGPIRLGWGERMRVVGRARPVWDVVDLGPADAWDRWVESRSRRFRDVRSAARVHADIFGIDDLDEWGVWQRTSEWGWAWFPKVSSADWAPYRSGRWAWRDPWGWNWLSNEPWGWAPYHHGRWVLVGRRWAWLPVGPKEPRPTWSPATVDFVENRPGVDAREAPRATAATPGRPGPTGSAARPPLPVRRPTPPPRAGGVAPTPAPAPAQPTAPQPPIRPRALPRAPEAPEGTPPWAPSPKPPQSVPRGSGDRPPQPTTPRSGSGSPAPR